jgi:acyl carrier protein
MDRRARIVAIINKVSNKKISFAPDESLFESGLLDSFTLQDMVAALENEFAMKIPDRDLNPRKFDTVERIEKYLEARA